MIKIIQVSLVLFNFSNNSIKYFCSYDISVGIVLYANYINTCYIFFVLFASFGSITYLNIFGVAVHALYNDGHNTTAIDLWVILLIRCFVTISTQRSNNHSNNDLYGSRINLITFATSHVDDTDCNIFIFILFNTFIGKSW